MWKIKKEWQDLVSWFAENGENLILQSHESKKLFI